MPATKISQLPSGGAAQATDAIPVARGGTNVRIAASDIAGTANAASATKLATSRNINGVPFDGTADITLDTVSLALSAALAIVFS